LVEEEGTRTVMAALLEVIENRGIFCALYSDRGTHFFVNPKAGEPVDKARLTQVGRALRELGIQMIPAYSPQARGRMERSYRTWQGRLPQELRIRGLKTTEAANAFLRTEYIDECNRRFAVAAVGKGSAFVSTRRRDLDLIFSIQHPRTVNQDNTVTVDNRVFQIEKTRWRNTLAGCSVVVHEHLDDSITIQFGPHEVARFAAGHRPDRKAVLGHGARPLGHGRAKKLSGPREEPAIPSRPLISQRSHPSSLPFSARRAGLTGPGCATEEVQLIRGNGRP
jgi:hypothetical protein